jgi:glycosyltransferase involved in cell wall biosynthesis
VSRFAVKTRAEQLGDLAVSVLKGEHGHQRKEVERLAQWLASDVKPEVVNLTNVLLSGLVHEIKGRLQVPVVATLQGDDVFLEFLPEPFRSQALELIRAHYDEFDGFIATSRDYADFMSGYLGIPRPRIDVVYPGLNLHHFGASTPSENGRLPTIGYFARICPEKGLHVLAEAFGILRKTPGAPPARLRVSGWLGDNHRPYFNDICGRIEAWGLAGDFEHTESPDHASKVRFLQSLDVLSVPTTFREPKGLYVLEALASGVPVVQPRSGSFPELVEMTGGGLLVNPEDPHDLARALRQLLEDAGWRAELGRQGRESVQQKFSAALMAEETVRVYRKYLG